MPKTNHARNFVDDHNYIVPACEGIYTNWRHKAAHKRRGIKVGLNNVNRRRMNRATEKLTHLDWDDAIIPTPAGRSVPKLRKFKT